ncbi:MAG TPA: diacylglycerol kinase family protein [Desulfobacterales bacterium]|nr:diacylglycerol kinase family protein [Desulfobacterales bacterium]
MKHATDGIIILLKTQCNAWIHAFATIVVVILGLYLGFSKSEWCWIVIAIIAVWTAEALNTALEFLADAAIPDHHPLVGKAKDVAAGAVLISAIGSVIIGLLILGSHISRFFGK